MSSIFFKTEVISSEVLWCALAFIPFFPKSPIKTIFEMAEPLWSSIIEKLFLSIISDNSSFNLSYNSSLIVQSQSKTNVIVGNNSNFGLNNGITFFCYISSFYFFYLR